MLAIKGDKRITDIYFGEYMRLYTHYAFRESVKRALEIEGSHPSEWKPQYLDTSETWLEDYFNGADTTARNLRRKYFSGPMSL